MKRKPQGIWQLALLFLVVYAVILVALYFGFCGRDVAMFRAFLAGYDPAASLPTRRQLLAYTLLHRFGLSIIAAVLGDEERRDLSGIDELAGRLFPDLD